MSKCATKQQGYRTMFQRDDWGRETQLMNLLLPRSAPTHTSQWGVCTSSGALECFSLDTPQALFLRRAGGADTFSCRCYGPDIFLVVISVWWTGRCCLYPLGGRHESCQWQEIATSPVHQPSFATTPAVGSTKVSKSLKPCRPSNNTG